MVLYKGKIRDELYIDLVEETPKKVSRRDFLTVLGLMLVSGKVVSDTCISEYNKHLINKIYRTLPDHVYLATHTGTIVTNEKLEGRVEEHKGCGVIVNGHYITMAHIIDLEHVEYQMFGTKQRYEQEIKDKKSMIGNIGLEQTFIDVPNDIAIFKILEEGLFGDFPAKPSYNINRGDEVYIIGNPYLKGMQVRKANISGVDDKKFSIDSYIVPGDSGTPVVNKDFELIGLCYGGYGEVGLVNRIKEYIEHTK